MNFEEKYEEKMRQEEQRPPSYEYRQPQHVTLNPTAGATAQVTSFAFGPAPCTPAPTLAVPRLTASAHRRHARAMRARRCRGRRAPGYTLTRSG